MTHPFLVSQQEDVILDCIDSPDITIRIQALDLVQGMVTGDILVSVVSRLMKQLKAAANSDRMEIENALSDPHADSDSDSQAAAAAAKSKSKKDTAPLPEDYRFDVIGRILSMSSKNNYANILDFDWYIDVLTQLVRMTPVPKQGVSDTVKGRSSVSEKVGDELRNVAVKVQAMRASTARAAENILSQLNADTPAGHQIKSDALKSVVWILGEYPNLLTMPDATLNGLLQLISRTAKPEILSVVIHATTKVFSSLAGTQFDGWTAERKTRVSLLLARMLHSMEPLALHPNLEVQERAVEMVELLKLTTEAASAQPASTDEDPQDPPLLLTQALPSLFNGGELNSVAPGAQFNVPMPDGLDLDQPIHSNLDNLLSKADAITLGTDEQDDFDIYYHQRPAPTSISSSSAPAISRLAEPEVEHTGSYQQPTEDSYLDADIVARRKAERQERNKDDPFYIASGNVPQTSSSIHNILQNSNGPDLDIDSIPIMQLDLEKMGESTPPAPRPRPKQQQKVVIASDETLRGGDGSPARTYDSENNSDSLAKTKARKLKQSLLQVDSSTIGSFNLEGEPSGGFDHERQQREDAEMQQAVQEVERLRLEMQRANERIQVAQGVDAEGAVVTKKKKKKTTAKKDGGDGEGASELGMEIAPKKKKAKKPKAAATEDGVAMAAGADDVVDVAPKKKKKKKKPTVDPVQGGDEGE